MAAVMTKFAATMVEIVLSRHELRFLRMFIRENMRNADGGEIILDKVINRLNEAENKTWPEQN